MRKLLLIFLSLSIYSFGQVYVKGIVNDALKKPIAYVNIIAKATKDTDVVTVFAITDEKGRYKLKLKKKRDYVIEISSMGYGTLHDSIFTNQKKYTKSYVLKEQANVLEVVDVKLPVYMSNDTTHYDVSKFTNGKERKLKNILKKLPGVEIDKGKVIVNGKEVTTMLVDGKPFFGGGSKIAIDNIPGDAIAKVEAIDNYNPIGFLKKVSDSDKLAMNIRLKKNKNRFVFGDVEVAKGQKDFHKLYSAIFRYTPTSNVSFIGNTNNVGERVLSYANKRQFKNNSNSVFSDFSGSDDATSVNFSPYVSDTDIYKSKRGFAGLNIQKTFSKKFEIYGFGIFAMDKTQKLSKSINEYKSFIEKTTSARDSKNNLGSIKITSEYKGSDLNRWLFKTLVQKTNKDSENSIFSNVEMQQDKIISENNGLNDRLIQNIEWHNNQYENRVFSGLLNYSYSKATPQNIWNTNRPILHNISPIVAQDVFRLYNKKHTEKHKLSTSIKCFYIFPKSHHQIDFTLGNTYKDEFYKNSDGQIVTNQENNFIGFGNNYKYVFHDLFTGIFHRYKKGIWKFNYGTYLKHVQWELPEIQKNKFFVLPKVSIKIEFNKSKSLSFNYNLKTRFRNGDSFSMNNNLSSYQSIFRGNPNLENSLYHNARLYYRKYNSYRGYYLYISTNYRKELKGFRKSIAFDGRNRYSSIAMISSPNENLSSSIRAKKNFGSIFNFRLSLSHGYSKSKQEINKVTLDNFSNAYSYRFSAEMALKKVPIIELGIRQSLMNNKSLNQTFINKSHSPFVNVQYDFLKYFQFEFDYTSNIRKTKNNTNTFEVSNTSLHYLKDTTPWKFSLYANNLFDTKYKLNNSLSSYVNSENRNLLLPRVIMFSVGYKL